MKRDAARQKYTRELFQLAVELDSHAALRCSKGREPGWIVCVVREDLQALHDKRRQQLELFFFSDCAMNTRREDDCHA